MPGFGAGLFSIVVINLLLSGDNALVIGLAVRGLPTAQKRRAIVIGTGGALLLRVALTALAAQILKIPLLEAGGGLLLAWITYRLLLPGTPGAPVAHDTAATFGTALRTIIVADVSMSLDNVLAVGAAAQGDLVLLLIGLSLSMAIIMAGGTVISLILERLPWLVYLGAGVLLFVAGDLMGDDPLLAGLLGAADWRGWALAVLLALGVGAALLLRRGRRPGAAAARRPESDILKV